MAEGQIIVTGASRGIGAAIAAELVRRGYPVACLSRSGTIPFSAGPGVTTHACDMTDEVAVCAAIARIAETGPVAGLVNNAGQHAGGPTASLTRNAFEGVMALNATAPMIAAREIYRHLRENGGLIINIGSLFDKMGVPDNLAYCASKAAVAAMTRCLAVEWAADGIRVLNVAPGYIETDLNRDWLAREKVRAWLGGRIPTGGAGQPEVVARLVGALFDEDIGYLTGETIYLDGGQGINH